jgi:hypothetical protein
MGARSGTHTATRALIRGCHRHLPLDPESPVHRSATSVRAPNTRKCDRRRGWIRARIRRDCPREDSTLRTSVAGKSVVRRRSGRGGLRVNSRSTRRSISSPGTASTSSPARCASARNAGSPSVTWNAERRTPIRSARPGPPRTAAPLAPGSGGSSAGARAGSSLRRQAGDALLNGPGVPDRPRASDHRPSERPRAGSSRCAIAVSVAHGPPVGAYPPATPCVFT